MSMITWVYPSSVDELEGYLRDGARPVGGGTGLMRNAPKEGVLADLSAAGIGGAGVSAGTATLGGTATFAETILAISAVNPENIVAKALSSAASPALRNTITIGGSLALFPPWSRLVGPLVALDATVRLVGRDAGTYTVAEYVNNADLKEQNAVVESTVDVTGDWETHWYPFTPVRFNYPLLTVTTLVRSQGGLITESRIVITGTRGRFERLTALEETVKGMSRESVTVDSDSLGAGILGRQGFTADYLTHLASVAVRRALQGSHRSAA